jgi:maltose alpha-D-glucosyltransferase/alpha-amylase
MKKNHKLSTSSYAEADPLWYKDAVIYQVHVKSFFDKNNDGVGGRQGGEVKQGKK